MASNNTTKQDILALFPDNTNNEITAEDLRISVENLFNDKETPILRIDRLNNLAFNNTRIYEGSLLIIYADNNTGLYLSKINQPLLDTDLIKIAEINSNIQVQEFEYIAAQDQVNFTGNDNNGKDLSLNVNNNNVSIYRNGRKILSHEFTFNNNSVILLTPSSENDTIVVQEIK